MSFGFIGIALAYSNELAWAGVMVFVAAAFDYTDGFAARMLNAQSEVGKELDSLADMVAFGVLPGIIAYQFLNGIQGIYFEPFFERAWGPHLFSMSGFLLTACSALRLAKFNVDTRQSENFLGLPTPAMAIFFASFPIIAQWQYEFNMYVPLDKKMLQGLANLYHYDSFDIAMVELMRSKELWLLLILTFSALMVSSLPIMSMKLKSLSWEKNKWRYIYVALVLISAALCFVHYMVPAKGIPWLQLWFLPLVIIELLLISLIKLIAERAGSDEAVS